MPAPFTPGDRVKLHCLRSRPELNGTAAEILEYFPDVDKYSVSIAAGERFRVAAKNVTPATPPPPPSVGAATPPPTPPAPKDPTIFVSGGQFLQPLAPLVRAGPRPLPAPHCEELPAGHWEVRWVEVESGRLADVMMGVESSPAAPAERSALRASAMELDDLESGLRSASSGESLGESEPAEDSTESELSERAESSPGPSRSSRLRRLSSKIRSLSSPRLW